MLFLKVKSPKEAVNFLNSVVMDNWNKGIALNEVVVSYYEKGDIIEVDNQLNKVKELLIETGDYRDKRFLIRIFSITLSKMGRVTEALSLLKDADEVWNTLRVLRPISNYLGNHHLKDVALKISEEQPDLHSKVLLLCGVVNQYCLTEQFGRAQAVYENFSKHNAMTKVKKDSQVIGNIHSSVIEAPMQAMDLKNGMDRLNEIMQLTDEGAKPILMARLSTSIALGGFSEEVQQIMDKSIQLTATIENSNNRANAYCEISQEFSKQGKIEDALKISNEINYIWNLTPALRQLANNLTILEDYDLLFSLIHRQEHSISILIMMDQVTKVIKPSAFNQVISFVKKEVHSELTKTHVYIQLLQRCYIWRESINILPLLTNILPDISYSKDLVSKWVITYFEFKRLQNPNSQVLEDIYTKFNEIVNIDYEWKEAIDFSSQNLNEWIDQVDEEDFIFVQQLIKRVKANRISENQFKELIRDLINGTF
jgi:hypothetical protein